MKRKDKPPVPSQAIEMPAKLMPGHVQDRNLSPVAGAPKGWRNRNEHPLSAAFASNKIEADEFSAGEAYRAFFEAMGRSGRDSTEFVVITGSRTLFTETQVAAMRIVQSVELHLPEPYRSIVRRFCGEGWSARMACCKAGEGNPRETWATIRLSLSKLAAAFSKARVNL